MRRAIEIGHQPFVRIHHQRVRHFDPANHIAEFRTDHRCPRPGGIDMAEQPFITRNRQNLVKTVTDTDAGPANNAAHRTGTIAGGPVSGDRLAQGIRLHRTVFIHRHLHQIFTADPGQEHRFLNRGMRLCAAVDTQHRLPGQPLLLAGPVQRLFTCGQNRRQGGHAGAGLDHPVPALADPGHLPQPVENMDLHLGAGGRGLPQHALRRHRRGQPFGKNRRRAAVGREIGEETRMLPVGDMRNDKRLKIGENVLDRFCLVRRRCRQTGAHLAGTGWRPDRSCVQRLQIGR